jgi:hypothetical protein
MSNQRKGTRGKKTVTRRKDAHPPGTLDPRGHLHSGRTTRGGIEAVRLRAVPYYVVSFHGGHGVY